MVTRPVLSAELQRKAARVRLLLTDCDGVLTDGGIYYSDHGEAMRRFSVRDGMAVERLRRESKVEIGIISGEGAESIKRRAEKLGIEKVYLGIREKCLVLEEIIRSSGLKAEEVAYIGDDINDVAVMQRVGLTACPVDADGQARLVAHYRCECRGGHGAFREFAELIIAAKAG